jgi:hypothetical protein
MANTIEEKILGYANNEVYSAAAKQLIGDPVSSTYFVTVSNLIIEIDPNAEEVHTWRHRYRDEGEFDATITIFQGEDEERSQKDAIEFAKAIELRNEDGYPSGVIVEGPDGVVYQKLIHAEKKLEWGISELD